MITLLACAQAASSLSSISVGELGRVTAGTVTLTLIQCLVTHLDDIIIQAYPE
jgi:hypothetical protein